MQVGDKIVFGSYEWRVLEIQSNAALIITEYIIEQRPYHNCSGDVTWAGCSLRKYLNGEFYDNFTAKDKSRIIPVLNKNLDNPWYDAKGGEDTKDYIYLLNIEETVCVNTSVTAAKTLKTAAPSNDTGFKGKMKTTLSEDRHSMGMYGGGGFGHPGVTTGEPCISMVTAI